MSVIQPKVLIFDIETAPIIAHVWSLWNNDVGLNQVQKDWHLLSWAAKWLGDSPRKIMYQDQRNKKNIEDDKALCSGIWHLLNEADIVITQNGKKFDAKKLNARFIINGFKPPSSYKHIDTCQLAKKHFGFTSNKLEYMTDKLCVKYKKLALHKKFPGHQLWSECLKNNQAAWREMERYNKYDVLSLEELYQKLQPWDNSVRFHVWTDEEDMRCNCGSTDFIKNGKVTAGRSRYQRFRCTQCGTELRGLASDSKPEKQKKQLVKVT